MLLWDLFKEVGRNFIREEGFKIKVGSVRSWLKDWIAERK